MEFFGELLAELRKDKKLSQKELADIFHLVASTISSYEMGVHSPHVDQLAKFADYFNVSTDYLLGRTSSDLSPQVLEETFSKVCRKIAAAHFGCFSKTFISATQSVRQSNEGKGILA